MIRLRSKPNNPATLLQQNAVRFLNQQTLAWTALTPAQRTIWNIWASDNPVISPLGEAQPLSGQQAYITLSTRQRRNNLSPSIYPPVTAQPSPLTSCSLYVKQSPAEVRVTFTPTPLPSGFCLEARFVTLSRPSKNPGKAKYRECQLATNATTSPFLFTNIYQSYFGSPLTGSNILALIYVYDRNYGLRSTPQLVRTTAV